MKEPSWKDRRVFFIIERSERKIVCLSHKNSVKILLKIPTFSFILVSGDLPVRKLWTSQFCLRYNVEG